MARIETYAFDNNLSLDDFVIGSDADNINVTRNYPLSGIFSTFKTGLNLASIEYTFSDGTDPLLNEFDAGYFVTNGNETAATSITTITLNTLDGNGIDITSLLEVINDQPTSFVLRVFKASVVGQVFYFAVSGITDNLDDTYTITVTNFVGGNSLIDATTYSMVFDLAGVPSIYTETDPVFLASPVGSVTAPQVTNWDTAFGWGDHASGGYQAALSGTGIVKSTAGTISYLTDNSTNWNTAFGWGNHASGGYLTSYTETDPVFLASDAAAVTSVKIGTWDLAYTWGDHSVAGYITAETDPVFVASDVFGVTTADINSWDAAYQWGNHTLLYVDFVSNQYAIGGEKTFTGAVQLFDGRVGVQTPVYGGSRLGDSGFQTPAIDTQTLLFKDTGQATAVGMFATAVGGSDGYVFSFKNFVDDVIVYNIAGVGAADYTDGVREVETTFALRNDYTAGQFTVLDTFNQDYPSGVATEVRQAMGTVAIHGGGATAKEVGLWRYDTTTYTQIWGLSTSDVWNFEIADVQIGGSQILTEGDTLGDNGDVTITAAAKGDILVYNGTAWIDLTVGTDTHVLTADSLEASGVKWAASAGGGGSIGGSITDNQIAVGATTADDIEGSANLTWDLTTLTAEGGIRAEAGYVNAKRTGGTADTHIAGFGNSGSAGEFVFGGNTTGVTTTLDRYVRIGTNILQYYNGTGSTDILHSGYSGSQDFTTGGSFEADQFRTTGDTSTANANNWDTEGRTAGSNSIWTTSNTTASTNFPSSFGQTFWLKGASDDRSFAFWKNHTAGDVSELSVGALTGGAWDWYRVANEQTNVFTVDGGSSNTTWTLQSDADVVLHLEADTDNAVSEDHNPRLRLSQDGDAFGIDIGIEGTAGTKFTGSKANYVYFDTETTSTGIQFTYGGTLIAEFSDNIYFDDIVEINSGSGAPLRLYGTNTGNSNVNFIELYDSSVTRQAYIGFPSGSNSHLYFNNNVISSYIYIHGTTGNCTSNKDFTGVDFNATSDQRLKHDIEPLGDYPITTNWVSYKWNDNNREDIGLIAQDLEKTNPEFVTTDPETDMKAVNYTKLLVGKMAEKDKQVSKLEYKNKQLGLDNIRFKTEIEDLKERVDRLEGLLTLTIGLN